MSGPALRTLAVALVLALLGVVRPAAAQVDPRLTWRTLETEHFSIHFPDGAYPLALDTGRYLEAAHRALTPLLGHSPWRRTEVVLTDDVDTANGSATSIPYPRIRAFMTPPELGSVLDHYDDWLWLLLLHEYVHVVHLDTASGLPELGNRIFGNVFGPNFLQPGWITEGLATRYESALTGRGRNRSPRVDAWLRAQVLESGHLWPLDKLSGHPVDWPGASHWYTYGGRAWEALVAARGEGAPARVSQDYAGRAFPFALNLSSEAAVATPWSEAFEAWRARETARHRDRLARVEAAGLREGRTITRLGRTVEGPRWTPDGEALLAYVADGTVHPAIRRVDPRAEAPQPLAGTAPVVAAIGPGVFALTPDGEVVVQSRTEVVEQRSSYHDLWAAPVGGGPAVQLTRGLRARDPALSPDGRRLAFVAGRRGEMAVYQMAVRLESGPDGLVAAVGPPEVVFHRARVQVDRPTFSPDGTHLAFVAHRGDAGRDVALLRLEDLPPEPSLRLTPGARSGAVERPPRPDALGPVGEVRWVTDDAAEDGDPAFGPAGDWLYFSSARDGVYDVYGVPLAEGEVAGEARRVTRVRTGAFFPAPSPDGRTLAYVTITAGGQELAVLDLDPAAAPVAASLPSEPPDPHRVSPPHSAEVWPVVPYRPWRTLRPWYWTPTLLSDAEGTTLGIQSQGDDVVGRHAWRASLWWGLASGEPGWNLGYGYRGLFPLLDVSTSRRLVGGRIVRNEALVPFTEIAWGAGAGVTLTDPGVAFRQSLRLSVAADHRVPASYLEPPDPLGPRPVLPEAGTATRVGLSWAASTTQRFAEAIGTSHGVSLSLGASLGTHLLGGDFDFLQLTGGVAGYLPLPWARHVLALNLDLGLALGEFGGRSHFLLGGLPLVDPVLAIWQGTGGGGGLTLRGYPRFAFGGDALAVANGEWRFPLLRPQRGIGLMPVFLRRLHGAVFVDAGIVAPVPLVVAAEDLKVGTGAELRAEIELGYELLFLVRLGLATGLTEGAAPGPYLVIGGAF